MFKSMIAITGLQALVVLNIFLILITANRVEMITRL